MKRLQVVKSSDLECESAVENVKAVVFSHLLSDKANPTYSPKHSKLYE